MSENQSFFKAHADAIAVITVNIAIFAFFFNLHLTNISSISTTNARIDNLLVMIHEENNRFHEESKSFYGRLEKQDAEYKAHMMYYHDKRD